jgi:ribonuclease HI
MGWQGVGGAIMSLGGTIESSFAWGLGISSNNTAEVYALLQGLRLAIESSIQSLIVVGDLKTIIGKMVSNATTLDNLLASVLEWEKKKRSNSLVSSSFKCFKKIIK